ncbi:MAG: sugar transferase [Phycisphaerales bacterium]
MPTHDEPRAVPWTLWGCDPIELHDRLWLRRGVRVVRPGVPLGPPGGVRRYLALPEAHQLALMLPNQRASRGTHRVRTIASCRTSYHEYLDFDEDHAIRSIRRQYGPNGSARADCVLTSDARLARSLSDDVSAMDRLNGAAPLMSQQPGIVLYDARDADECARWLGAVIEQGDDPAEFVPGVRRLGPWAWGSPGAEVPASVRLAGPVFLGRGVRLPAGSVVVGPAVLPDGWTDEERPARAIESMTRADARPIRVRKPAYEATKRAFDIVAASVLLALASPLMLVIAAAIRVQDGAPVLFRQARQTHGGDHFACLKFRTMVRNADEMQQQLREQNQVDGPQFSMVHDPRILPIGRWLRKTQLDELPQFWNVIRGEMSLVGPRPSPEYENQCCPPWREARLSVPAGITGLWQVRRRRAPDTDFQEWIRYDIEYAARRGWRLDLCILAETAWLFVPYRARIARAVLRACRRIAGRRTPGTPRT